MVQWQFYPKNIDSPPLLKKIIDGFQMIIEEIDSETHQLSSDEVLNLIRPFLQELGFQVETGKKAVEKIRVPVLFGLNGVPYSRNPDSRIPNRKRGGPSWN